MGFRMANKPPLKVNNQLINDLTQALRELGGWGSVEIFVQEGKVTQITKRAIKKTNHSLEGA